MDLEERPSVNLETAKFVGFEIQKKVVAGEVEKEVLKVFVGGRLISLEEQERVLVVLKSLQAYIKVKMADNFFGAKEKDVHDHPEEKKGGKHVPHDPEVNALSAHQSQR